MVAANLRSSNIYVLLNMTIHFLSILYLFYVLNKVAMVHVYNLKPNWNK